MNSFSTTYPSNSANAYKRQDIETSSPEKCVLHIYDAAIQSCVLQQQDRARLALTTLIDALNFESGGEVAIGLFKLYDYCLRMVHEKDFENPRLILKDLRDTWQTAVSQLSAA